MKKYFIVFFGLILSLQLSAQAKWDTLSPFPTTNSLFDTHFISEETGWIVGSNGTVMRTTDGGSSWDLQYYDSTKLFKSVFFIDENEGWVGGKNYLIHTLNGGDSWELQYLPAIIEMQDIYFLNHDTGWIVGDSYKIFKTVNGGVTWGTVSNFNSSGILYHISFTDALHGHIVGGNLSSYYALFYSTNDGGETWTHKTPENVSTLTGEFFISHDTGWICSGDGKILKTSDCGNSWEVQWDEYGPKKDIRFFNSSHGIVLSKSYVLVTNNGGMNWEKRYFPTSSTQNAFSFSGQTGFSVGFNGYLYKTDDFGETWTEGGSHMYGTLTKIFFLDTLNGWGIYTNKIPLAKTSDGGITWEDVDIGANCMVLDFSFPSAQTGYAIDCQNFVYKTTDGGNNWQKYGIAGEFSSICFVNEQKGFIGGLEGIFFMTTDGGETWNQGYQFSTYIRDILFLNEDTGWVLTDEGTVYVTEDGGSSWTGHPVGLGNWGLFQNICFIDSQKGFASNYYGHLYMTTDAGNTWEDVFYDENVQYIKVAFTTETNGWLIAYNKMFYTVDGGNTWIYYSSPGYLNDIFFLDKNNGWICGRNSFVMRYKDQNTNINKQEKLSFKISPNPVRENVNIVIPDKISGQITLTIYDISGKELYKSNINPDLNLTVTLDIANLEEGLYFIGLKSKDKSMTVKMLKVD